MQDVDRLARAAQRGDADALEAFVRATQADVWRWCIALVGRANAEDVVQDTYARALRALPAFEGRSSARTWLLSIARRASADWVRGRQRRERLRLRLVGQAVDESEAPPHRADLDELLAGLDSNRREAFVLTQLLGFSYADAAEVCGCPIGTIRSRVARARLDLLAAMTEDGNQPRARAD